METNINVKHTYLIIYILISALLAMSYKSCILDPEDTTAQYVRGFTALGVSFGGENYTFKLI